MYVKQLFSANVTTLFVFKIVFAHANINKLLPKVGYFSRISVISEVFPYCPTAQTIKFMFSNVTYRATIYRTGNSALFVVLRKAVESAFFSKAEKQAKFLGFGLPKNVT